MAQRVYGLALGYEDLNDHEKLRNDPLLAVLVEPAFSVFVNREIEDAAFILERIDERWPAKRLATGA